MKNSFYIKNILGTILKYLSYKEIILLSQCDKTLNKEIDPDNNSLVNNIFLDNVSQTYFNSKDYNLENKKNLSDDYLESKKNWKSFLKELHDHFKNYDDKAISNRVQDFFKLHLYLPDLRKENFHLEYEFSSTHQYICYDLFQRRNIYMNRLKNHITKEYLLESMKNHDKSNEITVKPVKKGEFFEKELLNFSSIFNIFVNNNDYYNILDDVINYNYTRIDLLYKNNKYNFNIINFILWISHSFILYSDYVYNFIIRFIGNNNIDIQTLFSEFIEKYEELVNCAQLINSKFENINIIINYMIKFKNLPNENEKNGPLDLSPASSSTSVSSSKSNNSSINNSEGFYLYKLFSKITKNNVCKKLSKKMGKKFEKLVENYYTEQFEKNESAESEKNKEDDLDCDFDYDRMDIEEDNYDYENEDFSMSDEKISNKELIEKYMNIQVDQEIDEISSKAINHTELKVSKEYEDHENVLINKLLDTTDLYIKKEKSLFEIFNIIKKITKSTGNTKTLSCINKSLNLIRRSKKRLMQKSISNLFKYVLPELSKDFQQHIKIDESTQKKVIDLSYTEIKNEKNYQMDLSEFDSDDQKKIVGLVKNELKNVATYLEEENIISYNDLGHKDEMCKLIEDYIQDCRIPYVLLVSKIIWFYYTELGYYEERNKIVIHFLKCTNKNESVDDRNDLREILNENLISCNIK